MFLSHHINLKYNGVVDTTTHATSQSRGIPCLKVGQLGYYGGVRGFAGDMDPVDVLIVCPWHPLPLLLPAKVSVNL